MPTEHDLRQALTRAGAAVPVDADAGSARVRGRVRMRRLRRAAALVVSLSAVAGLAATIVRPGGGDTVTVATGPSLDLGSARASVDLTISVEVNGTRRVLRLRGTSVIDFGGGRRTVTTSTNGERFETVTVDGVACMHYPQRWRDRLGVAGAWVCVDTPLARGRIGPALSLSGARFDEQLRAIDNGYFSSVAPLGVQRVNGLATTGYRLTAEPGRLDAARRSGGASEAYVDLTTASELLDVWLDRSGVVRRAVSTITEGSKVLAVTTSQTLVETPTAFGVPTGSIALPDAFVRLSAADLGWRLQGALDLLPIQ